MTPTAQVLVVDDDEGVRTSVAEILRKAGYTVLEAEDGVGALHVLDETKVAVLVLDVCMPRRDGISVLDSLDEPPAVVLMSAHCLQNGDRLRLEPKILAFLKKPFPPEKLLTEVAAVVNKVQGG